MPITRSMTFAFLKVIEELDFTNVRNKTMKEMGWTHGEANEALEQYLEYMALVGAHPTLPLVPTKNIDAIWHNHILDTVKYASDTQHVFGHFIHHTPSYGDENDELSEQFLETTRLYENMFGKEYIDEPKRARGPRIQDGGYCESAGCRSTRENKESGCVAACGSNEKVSKGGCTSCNS